MLRENRVSRRVGGAEIVATAAGRWKFPLLERRGQMQERFRACNANSAAFAGDGTDA
jgi:hypothetical protein